MATTNNLTFEHNDGKVNIKTKYIRKGREREKPHSLNKARQKTERKRKKVKWRSKVTRSPENNIKKNIIIKPRVTKPRGRREERGGGTPARQPCVTKDEIICSQVWVRRGFRDTARWAKRKNTNEPKPGSKLYSWWPAMTPKVATCDLEETLNNNSPLIKERKKKVQYMTSGAANMAARWSAHDPTTWPTAWPGQTHLGGVTIASRWWLTLT